MTLRRVLPLALIALTLSAGGTTSAQGDGDVFAGLCPATLAVPPGSSASLVAGLSNPGSVPREARLRLSVTGAGWSVEPAEFDATLAAGEQRPVSVTVTAAADAAERAEITLTIVDAAPHGESPRVALVLAHDAAPTPGAGECDYTGFTFSAAAAPPPAGDDEPAPPPTDAGDADVTAADAPPAPRALASPGLVVAGVAAASGVVAVGGAAAALARVDETWRVRLAGGVAALFTRLTKPKLLDHDTRRKVYESVRAAPGIHFDALRKALRLNIGTLVHHLRMLEQSRFVVSRREGRFRRYYPSDERLPEPAPAPLPRVAARIVEVLEAEGERPFAELARRLDVSKQRLSHNLKLLRARGVAELVEEDGDRRWVVRLVQR